MIIVEGMDNSGKSTLIEHLGKELCLPTARSNYVRANQSEVREWANWANASPRPLIVDRHPAISDLIYGKIIRGFTHSSESFAQEMRARHFLIYCSPPLHCIKESFGEREQMKGTHKNLETLYYAYEELMDRIKPDFFYDYNNPQHLVALTNQVRKAIYSM